MTEGRLYYVVGASGVGKDSLLRYARERLDPGVAVVFAHRYITRRADAHENHVELTEREFDLRRRHGIFVMDWSTHGHRYGVGNEVNYWLAMGLSVVVNGSRGYLATALRDYPDTTIVWVRASAEVIAQRLARRGRETPAAADARLHHDPGPTPLQPRGAIVHLNNNGPLSAAGDALVALLSGRRAATPPEPRAA
jgi:ribose 1,5-bisphosphokinase